MTAEVTQESVLSMQVCIPKDWTDKQVLQFAEDENPARTTSGWFIRRQGDKYLYGADERRQCAEKEENVHIVLDV